jgi:chondroitin AC lyase
MARNGVFDYSACGRELVRAGGGRSGSLISACLDAAKLGHPRTDELEAMAERLSKGIGPKTPALVGHRTFWRSEYSAHHRPDYFASVRLASKRVQLSETCNSENMLGEYLSDGVNYIYRTGEEYRGIMPVWDWRKIPGITVENLARKPKPGGGRGTRTFAGGVNDGMYGLAAMDFAKGKLSARKAWFFFDDEYVCLGAGITCQTDDPVTTALNQCRLNGDVKVSDTTGVRVLSRGDHRLPGVRWLYHDGVAYIPCEPTALKVRNDTQTGSWKLISYGQKDEPVSMDVFSAWIDHGKQVADGSYAYVVAPTMDEKTVATYASRMPVQVLENSSDAQAVYHPELKRVEAVFYKKGACVVPGIGEFRVDQPCALMASWADGDLSISAANPEHAGLTLHVAVPGRWTGADAKVDGTRTILRLSLPDGPEYAGSPVTVSLKATAH